MLLLEKSMPGISCSKIDCMGVWPSGTTYVEFNGVKVPKENVVGKVGEGFKQVMYNFNHERWLLAAQASRMGRVVCSFE
jgi:alkylation response protein AidB-like acyl-CoA dehydrogenase